MDTQSSYLPEGTLPTPGWPGRAIRLGFGAAILAWLIPSLIGELPALLALSAPPTSPDSVGFWIAVALALLNVHYVVDLGLERSWGRRSQLASIALFGAAVVVDLIVYKQVWAPPLGVALFAWLMAVYVPLGVAFVLAAALGTPGCEMRSYAHLAATLAGREASEHFCPGGVDFADRWGHREGASHDSG